LALKTRSIDGPAIGLGTVRQNCGGILHEAY
jgi:hypothetical protein